MNLYDYIFQKGLEKASLQSVRQMLYNDTSLSLQQRNALLAGIDTYSKAKDVGDLLTILSNMKR